MLAMASAVAWGASGTASAQLPPDTSPIDSAARAAEAECIDDSARPSESEFCPFRDGGAIVESQTGPLMGVLLEEPGVLPQTGPMAGLNPAGCWGHSEQPHLSTHAWNTVNATGRTWCTAAPSEIYVRSILYRHRWWGWETVDSDSNMCYSCYDVRVHVNVPCRGGQDSFLIQSSHTTRQYDGRNYYFYTEAGRTINC